MEREKEKKIISRKKQYEDIVENIKTIIIEKGLKQNFVAEQSGFSKQEFSDMLNDRRKLIRVEFIPNIAKSLNVEIYDLFKPRQ